ncbi:MAG: sphingosine kinase [Acidobacteria bacterium]|nr:sphingosine kinase [Acidobacteriota bacterium]
MGQSSPVTVIMNEASGGAASHPDVEAALARAGLDAHVERVKGAEVREAAERAAASSRTMIAAGGDGTVSTVASVAIRVGAVFGVIPLGTLNHFARDAGIPTNIDGAVAAVAAGCTRALDVGDVNGRTFLNNASLGIYPRVVWERETARCRGRGKWTAFALALARTWRRYPTVMVRMTIGDVHLSRRTPFVFVGNGEYRTEGLGLGTRASVDSGRLSIFLAPEYGRFEILTLPFRAMAGRLARDVKFEAFVDRAVVLEPSRVPYRWFSTRDSAPSVADGEFHLTDSAESAVMIAMDGELSNVNVPLRFSVLPKALRTIVPEAG